MPGIADVIVQGGAMSLWLAEQLLKDVKPEQFARKPVGAGGKVIDTNHPAFVYGHLAMYPGRMLEVLGLDGKAATPPAGFADLFAAGKECRDDPEGRIYPKMDVVTRAFFDGYRAAFPQIAALPDDRFAGPNPNERMRKNLPTLGAMINFLSTCHIMMHMGQVSAWRRCVGLGPVM